MSKIVITGVGVNHIDADGAAEAVSKIVRQKRENLTGHNAAYVCTPNAEIMMEAQKDDQLMRVLNEADLVIADGAGVVLAARILGYGKIERVPGFDLAKKLVENPELYPFSYYFLGGKPGVAESAARNLSAKITGLRIVGFHDGFFSEEDEPDVIQKINESGADMLFVALGAPRQEKWIYKNRDKLREVALLMGVGGTLDIFAKTAALSPPFFREHGLEWLYRLYKEPWRWKRMLKLPQYVLLSMWWRVSRRQRRPVRR